MRRGTTLRPLSFSLAGRGSRPTPSATPDHRGAQHSTRGNTVSAVAKSRRASLATASTNSASKRGVCAVRKDRARSAASMASFSSLATSALRLTQARSNEFRESSSTAERNATRALAYSRSSYQAVPSANAFAASSDRHEARAFATRPTATAPGTLREPSSDLFSDVRRCRWRERWPTDTRHPASTTTSRGPFHAPKRCSPCADRVTRRARAMPPRRATTWAQQPAPPRCSS